MYSVHNQLHFLCIWIIELLIQGCLKVATKGSWNKYYYFVFLLARKKLWKIIQDVRSSGGKAFEGFLLQFSWQVFHHKIVSYRGYNSFNSKSRVRRITLLFFFLQKYESTWLERSAGNFSFVQLGRKKERGIFDYRHRLRIYFQRFRRLDTSFWYFLADIIFFFIVFFSLNAKAKQKKKI